MGRRGLILSEVSKLVIEDDKQPTMEMLYELNGRIAALEWAVGRLNAGVGISDQDVEQFVQTLPDRLGAVPESSHDRIKDQVQHILNNILDLTDQLGGAENTTTG